jgi:guanyl-specific ribonuclease Sa
VKKKLKLGSTPKKEPESKAFAEAVAQFKAFTEARAKRLFAEYDLTLVAMVAAQVSREDTAPEDAVKHALRILDASRRELSARAKELKEMINRPVPVGVLHCTFLDGVRDITNQHKRPSRAEEYFRKFLVSEVGSQTAAKELERLKRDGFTCWEVLNYLSRYVKLRPPRKKI